MTGVVIRTSGGFVAFSASQLASISLDEKRIIVRIDGQPAPVYLDFDDVEEARAEAETLLKACGLLAEPPA